MDLSGTIAAVASGRGAGPRAIVRLSGEGTLGALCLLLVGGPGTPGAHAARLRVPALDDPGAHLEIPCLVLVMRGPRSYTGQDSAEIQVPGQEALVRRVLERALSCPGVRAAEPGEFTARAFLNGRISLDQAEGVMAMIAARSLGQAQAASRLLDGRTGRAYRALADDLASALALVEAGIDFTDQEDVVAISPADLEQRLLALAQALAALLGPDTAHEAPAEGVRAVLAGPPNAGKSTLFNALLGRARTVVSEHAGTTRDAIAQTLDLGGSTRVTLVDLPGLDGELARRSAIDRASQDAARQEVERADIVILCDPDGRFDSRMEREWLGDRAAEHGPPARGPIVLRVRTKADLPRAHNQADGDALAVCAPSGRNLGALRRAIADAAAQVSAGPARGPSDHVLLARHRRGLSAALEDVNEALRQLREADAAGPPGQRSAALERPEVIAGILRGALDALAEVAGDKSPDDVIGLIFASFCVGK